MTASGLKIIVMHLMVGTMHKKIDSILESVPPSSERAAMCSHCFHLPSSCCGQAVHGGTRFRDDVSGLRSQPPDLLVATPGRLTELITSDKVCGSCLMKMTYTDRNRWTH